MKKLVLIKWCETSIVSIKLFSSREALNKYVEETYSHRPEVVEEIVTDGGDYYTNEKGFALEVDEGELVE